MSHVVAFYVKVLCVMDDILEELYEIISSVHPELAGKLVGMMRDLGEKECARCLENQEALAERLDEALIILDRADQCRKPPPLEEKRIDPEDGKTRTFRELRALCGGQYSQKEIEDYWQTCTSADASANPPATASKVAVGYAAAKASAAP